ncbi:MAG TPA: helix-turn-helix domain-containing protein [Lacunisphaera sp.]
MQPSTSTPAPVPAATPCSNAAKVVSHLQRSPIYRDYHQAFEAATGLPLALRAAGSFQTPLQGSKKVNAFCALMAGTNKTCAACLQLQQRTEQCATTEAKTLQCFAGLSESAVPVRVGENVLGYLQTGQVLLHAPTNHRFRGIARQLLAWNPTADLRQLKTAYFATRVLARRQYASVVNLLAIFAQHLSAISNQIMVQEAAVELPVVTRARAYIAEHHSERLDLRDVARAVNMSVFYFCKIFKKTTGLTFTEYLARHRIERVKEMLLNPHMRISEAAYAAGFQSLSQFNRIFRRIAGESPTAYRDHLHGARPAARILPQAA